MASNLRKKLPSSDTLIVYDQNSEVIRKFEEEAASAGQNTGASIEAVNSPRAAAEHSVSKWDHDSPCLRFRNL